MTAQELHALTKDWPEGARPKELEWNSGYPVVQFFNRGCEYDIGALGVDHAIALHVASGFLYLIGEGYHSFIFDCGEPDVTDPSLTLYNTTVHGKTTLELISAAINAVKEQA